MQIEYRKIDELTPYENNPRINDHAVEAVASSIQEFGFKVPVIIDKDDVVIAGHTRIKAARQLGMDEVPTIKADDLTEEQVRAFRLVDNKTGELALWDFEKLKIELDEINIDLSPLDFHIDNQADEEIALDLDDEDYQQDDREKYHCPKCGFEFYA